MVYPKSYGTAIWVGLPAIGKHLKNIFEDGKLSQDMTVSKTEITTPQSAMDDKFQTQKVDFYHLDAVIAVRWATAIRAKVMASETGRASQMPGVPARWGMRIKDGTRKTRPRANEYAIADNHQSHVHHSAEALSSPAILGIMETSAGSQSTESSLSAESHLAASCSSLNSPCPRWVANTLPSLNMTAATTSIFFIS